MLNYKYIMIDTNFIKQHAERREQMDRRVAAEDTIVRMYSDRRKQDRRSCVTDCDIKFTKLQTAAILIIPVIGSIYIIYKLLSS